MMTTCINHEEQEEHQQDMFTNVKGVSTGQLTMTKRGAMSECRYLPSAHEERAWKNWQ